MNEVTIVPTKKPMIEEPLLGNLYYDKMNNRVAILARMMPDVGGPEVYALIPLECGASVSTYHDKKPAVAGWKRFTGTVEVTAE